MNSILNDIPSIPTIPSTVPFNVGITTRVMAKRQEMLKQEKRDEYQQLQFKDDVERRRRSSKFLAGARIPNSVIKLDVLSAYNSSGIESKQREHDDFIDKLIKRLQPQSSFSGNRSFKDDRESIRSIKKEMQERYNVQSILKDPTRQSKERRSVSISVPAQTSAHTTNKDERWQELKDKRRITRRTSILAPLHGEKLSTYESIKRSIENSKVMQQLLNVDHIEEEKMKAIHTEKSLTTLSKSRENLFQNNEVNIIADAETDAYSIQTEYKSSKEKVTSKRRSPTKSERSNKLIQKKSFVRQKVFIDKK